MYGIVCRCTYIYHLRTSAVFRSYNNASVYLSPQIIRVVVGTPADPVRTGDKVICQGDHDMVAVVSHFRSDAFNSSPHEVGSH